MMAGVIFLIGAALNLVPMFWQPTMLSMLSGIPAMSGWLSLFGAQGTMFGNLIAINILFCLGAFLILVPDRAVAWTAIVFLIAIWWLGQNFGGILTFPFGTATDPNSAPVLILFVMPILLGD